MSPLFPHIEFDSLTIARSTYIENNDYGGDGGMGDDMGGGDMGGDF